MPRVPGPRLARHRGREFHQFKSERDTGGRSQGIAIDASDVDLGRSRLRAHTEHRGVCTGSVETLVDGGHAPRDQLHLQAVERAIRIAHVVGHTAE